MYQVLLASFSRSIATAGNACLQSEWTRLIKFPCCSGREARLRDWFGGKHGGLYGLNGLP